MNQNRIKLQQYITASVKRLEKSPNRWIKEHPEIITRLQAIAIDETLGSLKAVLEKSYERITEEEEIIGTFAFCWDDHSFDQAWMYLDSGTTYEEWLDPDLGEYEIDGTVLVNLIFEDIPNWQDELRGELYLFQRLFIGFVEIAVIELLDSSIFKTIKKDDTFLMVSNYWHDTEYSLFYATQEEDEECTLCVEWELENVQVFKDFSTLASGRVILFGESYAVNTKFIRGGRQGWGSIPEEIQELKAVEDIELQKECISEIPVALYELPQLQKLNLSSNRITTISAAIQKLKQLKRLDLSNNKITQLPEEIAELTSLEQLSLEYNQLIEIPNISTLYKLTSISLSNNKLQDIPVLPSSTTWLNLNANELTVLPTTITALQNLKTLVLSDNKFEVFPEEILALKNIENIEIGGNKIKDIPKALLTLPNFKELRIYPNAFSVEEREALRATFKEKIFVGYDTDPKSFM
ncbi:leucine-rich repeat domain-containing protein [Aquimarina rhabdastrellae]